MLGLHNYGDATRGLGHECVTFVPALEALGYEVTLFDSLGRSLYGNFAALNRALIETAERLRPDLVLCVPMHYEIWTETYALLRRCGAPLLVGWGTDDSWKFDQCSRHLAGCFDVWATTSRAALERAARLGLDNVVLSQWAAAEERLAAPLPAAECRYPVSFVGSAYGNRSRWIDGLRARGVEVACFGHGWPAGPVAAERVAEIYRESALSLNFADSALHLDGWRLRHHRQIKARVFEVPGAGGLVLTELVAGLDEYFDCTREIVTFTDIDDLAARIRHLLAHPDERDRIARAGHERVRREHTYRIRFEALIAAAGRARRGTATVLPDLDQAEQAHRIGPLLRALRGLLVTPARWVWGPRRGPRAARRLVYELSWRWSGARTYSARGLPGRLFYRES